MGDTTNLFSLQDDVIIVTGGYGHIGGQVVIDLLKHGALVQCVGRTKEKLHLFEDSISSEYRKNLTTWDVNLVNEKDVEELINNIYEKFGRIDGLFNNAADISHRGIDFNLSKEEWLGGFDSILSSAYLCVKYCIPIMREVGKGSIINNASLFGKLSPIPNMYLDLKNEPPLYLPSAKGAVIQFTKYLSSILAENNIRVNSISPGFFPKKRGVERPDYIHEITSRIPMKRIGKPVEISGAIIYLLSNASTYVTGQDIVIDGGYSIW